MEREPAGKDDGRTTANAELHHRWHVLTDAERRAIRAVLRRGRLARPLAAVERERLPQGARVADAVAARIGSWPFIVIQSVVLVAWLALNVLGWVRRWDPYPFILLNLALSFQAAYSAPIIMMSQNRQAAKDRLTAELDYEVNLRAELEIAAIHARLDELAGPQWQELLQLQREHRLLLQRIEALAAEVHRVAAPPAPASTGG